MKKFLSYSLLAAAAAAGVSFADTATTKPVGYVTHNLAPNTFNLVGLTLTSPAVAAGDFEVSPGFGAVVTDSDVTFSVLSDRTYILEITSGGAAGIIQEIPGASISGHNITASQNLEALGVTNKSNYTLRVAPTLEEVFGTATLQKGLTANAADIIWIPDGNGGYVKYFQSSLSGNPFKNASTSANTPNVPLVYVDGILIEKRGTASTLTVAGEVKTNNTVSVAVTGFNVLSTVYPVGTTLQNLGLNLQVGLTANAADIVWVPDGNGGYTKYFRSSLSGNPWKNAATSANVTADVPLPSSILVERKGSAVNLTLTPPANYAGL